MSYTHGQYSIYSLGDAAGAKLANILTTEQKSKQSLWVENIQQWVDFHSYCRLDRSDSIVQDVSFYDVDYTYHAAGVILSQM
jgi:hypothetical protein